MKYIFIVDDSEANIDELHLKAISAPFIPIIREIFVSVDGTPVYLSKSETAALLRVSQHEAIENLNSEAIENLNSEIENIKSKTKKLKC